MPVPVSQMWTVATYVLGQRLRGRKRYPLVLMLEPLFRCNLACAGCGKIQYPAHVLKQNLSPAECFRAVDECRAPMVSIPGGEPLMHPQIAEIVEGLVARKKYIYLCTNALLLKEKLDLFTPSKYLTFSVHVDGEREHHDFSVCREGGYDLALDGMREALRRGFRLTTNTTLFDGADPVSVRRFFDEMMDLGVEGMMLSPGYSYDKAPDQKHFLGRARTRRLFRSILSNRKKSWVFNQSPLFLEFLMGKRDYPCTPWGMPTFNLFGWQKPCYLLQDGYADTFAELMRETEWHRYGFERRVARVCRPLFAFMLSRITANVGAPGLAHPYATTSLTLPVSLPHWNAAMADPIRHCVTFSCYDRQCTFPGLEKSQTWGTHIHEILST